MSNVQHWQEQKWLTFVWTWRWFLIKSLTSRVVQVELYLLSSERDGGHIFFEHWRRIFLFWTHRKEKDIQFVIKLYCIFSYTFHTSANLKFIKVLWMKPIMKGNAAHIHTERIWKRAEIMTNVRINLSVKINEDTILRDEVHYMTWKLCLPLESHLWHKPSAVMFSHSLHLPLSQF